MGFEITDGLGSGRSAGVDTTNKLLARATIESIFDEAVENGDAYFVGTPLITLTNAAESAIFILENNEEDDLIFENFFFIAEATTGGSPNMFRANFYKNPTSISSGTNLTPLNQNFGSSKTLDATTQYGAQGSAVTGGSLAATLSFPIGVFNDTSAKLTLPKGSSLAITITPPTSNTSMPVQFGARTILYKERY
jgi:hypothetical protein